MRYTRNTNGRGFELRVPAVPLSGSNLGQVVHTRAPLSPSNIIWYWLRDRDTMQLGR